jgi:multidrug efflux pump subunit AcrA (membrane-fusion protein)
MKLKHIYLFACLPLLLFSCKSADKPADDEDVAMASQTPVTVTTVTDSSLVDYFDVSSTSIFLQKNVVKANANGYIENVNTQLGHYIAKGSTVFTIKTKEAQSIGNSINILDTTFKFSGVNRIKAPGSGYITQLAHQKGDYVQDGEQLAIISDQSSFAFVMQLPYEMRRYVKIGQGIQLILPGGDKLNGVLASEMPSVDTLSQTQGMVIRVSSTNLIPENLVAKARIIKSLRSNSLSLPKSAILTNETQTDFWVMKLINPTTAVKTPITKGIETGDHVEILTPKFSTKDQIVVTGNYGLTDTAKVKIVQ